MDSDIFFDDSEVDQLQQERRLAENEARKLAKEQWNKGYMDGLEWAEQNWKTLELIEQNLEQFRNGFIIGQQKCNEDNGALFSEAGALNAYLLLADNRYKDLENEKTELKQMLERLNLNLQNPNEIDMTMVDESRELRHRVYNKMSQEH